MFTGMVTGEDMPDGQKAQSVNSLPDRVTFFVFIRIFAGLLYLLIFIYFRVKQPDLSGGGRHKLL
jgi:hypothetical protein